MVRYDLSLPVRLRVKGGTGSFWREGRTRDLSSRGVYLRAEEVIPVGSQVEMYVTLPELMEGSTVFVHAFGIVLRVEQGDHLPQDLVGVAARIEQYDVNRGQPPSS